MTSIETQNYRQRRKKSRWDLERRGATRNRNERRKILRSLEARAPYSATFLVILALGLWSFGMLKIVGVGFPKIVFNSPTQYWTLKSDVVEPDPKLILKKIELQKIQQRELASLLPKIHRRLLP